MEQSDQASFMVQQKKLEQGKKAWHISHRCFEDNLGLPFLADHMMWYDVFVK